MDMRERAPGGYQISPTLSRQLKGRYQISPDHQLTYHVTFCQCTYLNLWWQNVKVEFYANIYKEEISFDF